MENNKQQQERGGQSPQKGRKTMTRRKMSIDEIREESTYFAETHDMAAGITEDLLREMCSDTDTEFCED